MKKKELLDTGQVDIISELQRYYKVLNQDAINKWKTKICKPSLPGKKIRAALLPNLSAWYSRTHNAGMIVRMT